MGQKSCLGAYQAAQLAWPTLHFQRFPGRTSWPFQTMVLGHAPALRQASLLIRHCSLRRVHYRDGALVSLLSLALPVGSASPTCVQCQGNRCTESQPAWLTVATSHSVLFPHDFTPDYASLDPISRIATESIRKQYLVLDQASSKWMSFSASAAQRIPAEQGLLMNNKRTAEI